MTNGDLGWKGVLFLMGILGATYVVIGSVISLPIYPTWLRTVLLFALMAACAFSVYKLTRVSDVRGLGTKELLKEYWIYTIPYIATVILVIYTIIGVILGNIEWVWPGGGIGP